MEHKSRHSPVVAFGKNLFKVEEQFEVQVLLSSKKGASAGHDARQESPDMNVEAPISEH